MTNEVVIKSNKYGIILILPSQMPFPELLQAIASKFQDSGSFFKDAEMVISFEGRELSAEEELEIVGVIRANSSIKIVCVIDDDPEVEATMRERIEAYGTEKGVDGPVSVKSNSGLPTMGVLGKGSPMPVADFYKGNLRSGQTLECTSSVTLIGDVNPGAKIISDGNIVVLGSMKGNAHAGASGDSNCFIYALDMRPIQLQIGDLIAKSPDKESNGWRIKKRPRLEDSQYSSQVAVVRDGYICIEPMTKGCLDRL